MTLCYPRCHWPSLHLTLWWKSVKYTMLIPAYRYRRDIRFLSSNNYHLYRSRLLLTRLVEYVLHRQASCWFLAKRVRPYKLASDPLRQFPIHFVANMQVTVQMRQDILKYVMIWKSDVIQTVLLDINMFHAFWWDTIMRHLASWLRSRCMTQHGFTS